MDVNSNDEPIVDDSSTSEGQESLQAQSSSEGTENTENDEFEIPEQNPGWPNGVYERFKQVNEQKKQFQSQLREMEEQLQGYSKNSNLYKAYEQFESLLVSNPKLFEDVQSVLTKYYPGQQGNGSQVDLQTQQQYQAISRLVVSQHEKEYDSWAKENNVPEESREFVKSIAAGFLSSENPKWNLFYDSQALNRALDATKKAIDALNKSNMASYVQEKKKPMPRSASSGAQVPYKMPQAPSSQEERAQMLINALSSVG